MTFASSWDICIAMTGRTIFWDTLKKLINLAAQSMTMSVVSSI